VHQGGGFYLSQKNDRPIAQHFAATDAESEKMEYVIF